MAIMDPLLNTGFLWRCLAAYAGIKSDNETPQDEISSATMTTTNNLPEKHRQIDTSNSSSSSNPIESEETKTFRDPEHMHEDTYYTRLSIQSIYFKKKNF